MKEFDELTQNQKELYWSRMLEWCNRDPAFQYVNGMRVTSITQDNCEGVLITSKSSFNPYGSVHGGALMTLADTVGGCAAASTGAKVVTLNCTYDYLRAAVGQKICCKAQVVRSGRKIAVVHVGLTDEQGTTVGGGTYTYYMLGSLIEMLFPDGIQ